ncbi:MAG: hypothetical protein ACPL1F_00195 [bacterium]
MNKKIYFFPGEDNYYMITKTEKEIYAEVYSKYEITYTILKRYPIITIYRPYDFTEGYYLKLRYQKEKENYYFIDNMFINFEDLLRIFFKNRIRDLSKYNLIMAVWKGKEKIFWKTFYYFLSISLDLEIKEDFNSNTIFLKDLINLLYYPILFKKFLDFIENFYFYIQFYTKEIQTKDLEFSYKNMNEVFKMITPYLKQNIYFLKKIKKEIHNIPKDKNLFKIYLDYIWRNY